MCVRLENSSLVKDAATGQRHQRQADADPLFREISDVSCVFPISCGYLRLSLNCKCRRISSLQDAGNIRQSSSSSFSAANPLFQKILHVSGLFPGFCGHPGVYGSAKCFRINILTSTAKKKRGAGHSNGSKCGDLTPSVAYASSIDLATCNSGRVAAPEI